MNKPEDLNYSEDHEWVLVEDKEATIGISDHAQEEMGDIVFAELPELGEKFEESEDFAVIESVKAVSDLYLPLSGKVVEVNEDLLDQPELINEDPYGEGWIVKIEIADDSELDKLLDNNQYQDFLEEAE
jgi:glycine cleavage system H protein